MRLDQIVPVLQLSVSPVIVISGVGLLMLSMTNRYGRVIDRSRFVADLLRKGTGERETDMRSQLDVLLHRGRLLKRSISLAAFSLLLAALLVIALFVTGLAGRPVAWMVVVLFGGCMLSLIASLVVFMRDLNLSLAALDLEVRSAIRPDPVPR